MRLFDFNHVRLLLFGLWLVTGLGLMSVPLETHEVYVLETARAMESSGDWVLPRYNGAPRLMKPPLNYWATACLSKLDPSAPDVQIWHGRMISMLAGLLIVLATARLGATLYGKETGLLAALLLLGSQGYVHLSLSARPDMLYAAFCLLQALSWTESWRAKDRSLRQLGCGLLGWFFAALAALTKGPHVPALFLLAWLLFLSHRQRRHRIWMILRPAGGAPLFCLIALPWWFLLKERMTSLNLDLSSSELSGSLLFNLAHWHELLGLYYFRTLLVLLLPAVLLVLPQLTKLFRSRTACGDATRLLLWISAIVLVFFTLGGHYRKHYLLPVLPFATLFLARALSVFDQPALRPGWRKALLAALALSVLGCVGLILYQQAYWALCLMLAYVPIMLHLVRKALSDLNVSRTSATHQMILLMAPVVVVVSACNAFFPMSPWRMEEQTFSQTVGQSLAANARLAEWSATLATLPYFAHRNVAIFDDLSQVRAWQRDTPSDEPRIVVLPANRLTEFNTAFTSETLYSTHFTGTKKANFVCVKICGACSQP